MDPQQTYLILEPDNRAVEVPIDQEFWTDLMSGSPVTEHARRVMETEGRLLGGYPLTTDFPQWERHPAGDEVLILVSGSNHVDPGRARRRASHRAETGGGVRGAGRSLASRDRVRTGHADRDHTWPG